jgi:hypothetical protein
MKAYTQPGGGSEHVRQACKARALRSRYTSSGAAEHARNFAGGVAIGGIIVLFFWLMVG